MTRGSVFSDWCASFEGLSEMHPDLVNSLTRAGITAPTRIQADSWRPQMAGSDTVLQAETGSGKTLAYLLPILNRIYYRRDWEEREAAFAAAGPGGAAASNSRLRQVRAGMRPSILLAPTPDLCAQLVRDVQHADSRRLAVLQSLGTSWSLPVTSSEVGDHDKQEVIRSPRVRFGAVDIVVATVQKFAEDLPPT
eukprot:g17992.t1